MSKDGKRFNNGKEQIKMFLQSTILIGSQYDKNLKL
jgi:hypothetical protein